MTEQITTVVFDVGNVLVEWQPHLAVADRWSESRWGRFVDELGFRELNARTDAGLSLRQAVDEATARDPEFGEILAHYYEHFRSALVRPVPGTGQVVRDLKAVGVRLLGLSNWSAENFHCAPAVEPAISDLEDVMVSGDVGVAKPDPRIFQLFIDTCGVVPSQTVFIDDTQANIDAAASLGFVTVLFTDARQLRRDLERLGALHGTV